MLRVLPVCVFSCSSSFLGFSKFFGALGKHLCASVVDWGSQVSRHLISAARGRTTEIPNGLIYYVAKPLLREKAQIDQRRITLSVLTPSRDFCEITWEKLDRVLWRFCHATALNANLHHPFDWICNSAGVWFKIAPKAYCFVRNTPLSGKFGRDSTLIKWERKCLELSCKRTEVSHGPKKGTCCVIVFISTTLHCDITACRCFQQWACSALNAREHSQEHAGFKITNKQIDGFFSNAKAPSTQHLEPFRKVELESSSTGLRLPRWLPQARSLGCGVNR